VNGGERLEGIMVKISQYYKTLGIVLMVSGLLQFCILLYFASPSLAGNKPGYAFYYLLIIDITMVLIGIIIQIIDISKIALIVVIRSRP
jgi:hypothetical protein